MGYSHHIIEGFHFLVSESVLAHESDRTLTTPPLAVLECEAGMASTLLPAKAVSVLRTIPIWVEWNSTQCPCVLAYYHAGPKTPVVKNGVILTYISDAPANKQNCVEIVNMEALTKAHQPKAESGQCILIHELAHAVHHHLFDFSNTHIREAYQQATQKQLYAGRYANTNEREYFAELSCAYFDRLHYHPETAAALKEYDPGGYRIMELTWGTRAEIIRARNNDAKSKSGKAVATLRKLIQNGKMAEAEAGLKEFLWRYRETPTAEMLQAQFDQLVAGTSTQRRP